MDVADYHRLSPEKRAEVNAWLGEHHLLGPRYTRALTVLDSGKVAVSGYDKDTGELLELCIQPNRPFPA